MGLYRMRFWFFAAGIVVIILLFGCYDFNNPVDPEADNYQGFRSNPPSAPPALAAPLASGLDHDQIKESATYSSSSSAVNRCHLRRKASRASAPYPTTVRNSQIQR